METSKTYKREAAVVMGVFNAALIIWGLSVARTDIVAVAENLVPYTVAAMSAAFGADFVQKRVR